MSKELVIVFVKNIQIGKVKTRLAKTIGDQASLEVYKELVAVTENVLEQLSIDKRIYFSETIEAANWHGCEWHLGARDRGTGPATAYAYRVPRHLCACSSHG